VTHHSDDAANLAERPMRLAGGRLISRDRPWDDDDAVSPALNASVRTE
jgi:hypothetical protein